MRRSLLAAFAVFCLGVATAAADSATPEGAKAIEAAYAAYISQNLVDKGVVTVGPAGDDYLVTWNIEKAVAALGGPAGVVRIEPFAYRITPTLGGGWLTKASSLPTLTIGPTGREGREGGIVSFGEFHFDGLLEPSAPDFWRGKLGLGALLADVRARSGDDLQHIKIAENGLAGEMQVKTGDDADSVDVDATQSAASATQNTAEVVDDQDSNLSAIRQGATVGDGHVRSLRAAAFGDLWRFLVAHADDANPAPDALKPKLEALLPLWREAAGKVDFNDIDVAFPGGALTIKSVGQEFKTTGVVADAAAEWALALKEVAVTWDAAPDWAKSVWPASLQFRVAAGGGGLDRAVHLALDDPEFLKSGNLADDTRDAIASVLQQGRPHLTIAGTRLVTPLVEATLEGEAELAAEGPRAHARVTADDLDKVMHLLANVGEEEPNARQALFVTTFVKGLAKQEDGRLVWDIDYKAPNVFTVNGQRLGSQ